MIGAECSITCMHWEWCNMAV